MSKPDRAMTERVTPELVEWVDTVDRNATQKTVLARARAAHQAVWQAPQDAAAFFFRRGFRSSATGDFSFFYSAGRGAAVAEDDATARRLRRLQMLKLMLQEAQSAKGTKGRG